MLSIIHISTHVLFTPIPILFSVCSLTDVVHPAGSIRYTVSGVEFSNTAAVTLHKCWGACSLGQGCLVLDDKYQTVDVELEDGNGGE